MRYFLFLMIVSFTLKAQNDTLFKTDLSVIACNISLINKHAIYYLDASQLGHSVSLTDLVAYSQNGQRTFLKITPARIGTTDSVNVSDELAHMRDCFSRFHKQYSTGISITLVGSALAITSTFVKGDETVENVLGIGGLVMVVIGAATVIDSHKYFSKAGFGVSGKGNSAGIRYRFK